jgi:CHAD domain-containing protein
VPTATSFADGAAVRGLILAALRDAVEPARTARGRVAATPAAAVHDVRKALRRTRALLELIGRALPRRERKDIRAALVAARRSLGPARDLAVASEALIKQVTAPEVAPAAALIVAAARADAPSTQSVADDIGRAIDVAVAQHDAIIAALPDEVAARTLVRALAETYRRARRARRKAKRSDRAAHRWRRRSKELSYQLALFGDVPAAAELREALAGLDDELGKVVDRLMLGDFVGLYGHAADADAVGAILVQLHDELTERRDKACKSSKALFAARPRKLRKRLGRALAPPAAVEADPEPTSEGNGTPIATA